MKLSLATKIFLGFSLIIGLFGAVTIYGITQLGTVRDELNNLNRSLVPLDRLVAEIETLQGSTQRSLSDILRSGDPDTKRLLLDSNRRSFSRNMNSRLQQAQGIVHRVSGEPVSKIDEVFLEEIRARLEETKEQVEDYNQAIISAISNLDQTSEEEFNPKPADQLEAVGIKLNRNAKLLKLSVKNKITTKMLSLEREESSATALSLWLAVAAVAVGILITALSLFALRPIRRLSDGARRISRGDFSLIIDDSSKDEFGLLAGEFNRMAQSLAQRQKEAVRNQEQLEQVNRQMRQSGIDLELMKLYNENIIRSIHNGILVADARGVITTLNPAAETLWVLDPAQTIGRALSELPIAMALSELLSSWERVLLKKQRMVFDTLSFRGSSQSEVLVDLYVSPLVGLDGMVQGVILVGEDVTERVRTKQALIQSERLATIGRMSAIVAHEIRNPLSSIGLNAELLEEELAQAGDERAESRDLLHCISREVERLTEVTDEYLKFARLPKPNLVPEDPNAILISLLRFVEPECREAKVKVLQQLDQDPIRIRADEAQLRQAFLNLLKNSVQSMPDGGALTVSTKKDHALVEIRISDTGRGIEPACLDRIFDPFFSTRQDGTGLGLSLTQQIVTEHDGSIVCESTPGQGTCFVIKLPFCTEDPPLT